MKRDGTEVKRYQKSSEFTQSIVFEVPGTYVVECLVDGSYSLSCPEGDTVGNSIEKTIQKLLSKLDWSSINVIQK